MKLFLFAAVTCLIATSSVAAEVVEKRIEYSDGGTKLVGYFYSDTTVRGKAPGVIVFSDWMGLGGFARDRAKALAGLGYRAFAADVYGEEKQATDAKEAGALATKFKSDRPLMRGRATAALKTLSAQEGVDASKIAAMGFCFGGTVSLELARSGAPVKGVVSFHGGLATPDASLAKNIKGKVLALHGADDPYVPAEEVAAFEKEMRDAKVSWELVSYGNAVHSFTNPAAGSDNSKGAAYNELADKRSNAAMKSFFNEIFG